MIDATGKYVMPGGIDVHTHLDMPFGGTTSSDDFETGTIAAAFGGTTSIVDFAIQYRGQTLHHALERLAGEGRGQGGHRLRLPHDHDRADRPGRARDGRARASRASRRSSCSWRIPASSCSTMRRSSGRCCGPGENGGTICMHAENGGVIDVLVQQALARGQRPRRSTTRSRARRAPKPKPRTAPLPSPRSPTCRSTSSTSRPPRRSRW